MTHEERAQKLLINWGMRSDLGVVDPKKVDILASEFEACAFNAYLNEQCLNELFEAARRDNAFYLARIAALEAALEKADEVSACILRVGRSGLNEKNDAYRAARAKSEKS